MFDPVGNIYACLTEYYDREKQAIGIKSRPVLILKEPEVSGDKQYVALPVSTMLQERYRHARYDVRLEPGNYPLLKVKRSCFVRCHKQMTVYRGEIDFTNWMGDVKKNYPRLWRDILSRLILFEKTIVGEDISCLF